MSIGDHGVMAEIGEAPPRLIRAAEYLRMSTEHQRYSTLNQAARIRQFAAARGFTIVRSYADEGISGLTLRERPSLRQLLDDAARGDQGFEALLIYDVSRWGRFQDPDESAAHELQCRRAGIAVHYCAEDFENDGSIASTIIKSVKRAMAGEYSRELSVKCFAGAANLIRLGYKQGGYAGFGLRRMLVDEGGNPKHLLKAGERKSLATDRVILVPGPAREIVIVREIFTLFVSGWNELRIAAELNRRRIRTDHGRAWTAGVVLGILTNEKYIGNNVWARTTARLKQPCVPNPPERWVRRDGVFEAIVDPVLFAKAGQKIASRSRRPTNEAMLDALRRTLAARGHLSQFVIEAEPGLPSTAAYRLRFGGLLEAYRQIGFSPPRDFSRFEANRRARALHADILAGLIEGVTAVGGQVEQDPNTDQLRINGEFTLSVLVLRQMRTEHGKPRWRARLETGLGASLTLIVRLAGEGEGVRDYYLLPMDQNWPDRLVLQAENGVLLDAYRHDSLEPLFAMVSRTTIGRPR